MKKLAVFGAMAILLPGAFLTGCAQGPVVTRDFEISDFTAVDISHAFTVDIVPSQAYKVSITANDNLFDNMEVSKSGTTLKISLKDPVHFGPITLKARVGMPELTALSISGATKGTALGFKSDKDFSLKVSGASRLDMDMETGKFTADISGASSANGVLKARDSKFDVSGACRIKLNGSADNTTLGLSGASTADMPGFAVKNADVDVSGASHASLMVDGRLNVDVSGGSVLEYSGEPGLGRVEVSGGSNLRRK